MNNRIVASMDASWIDTIPKYLRFWGYLYWFRLHSHRLAALRAGRSLECIVGHILSFFVFFYQAISIDLGCKEVPLLIYQREIVIICKLPCV